jgi:hypothetical protein
MMITCNLLTYNLKSPKVGGIAVSVKFYSWLFSVNLPVKNIHIETIQSLKNGNTKRNSSICQSEIVKYISAEFANERKQGYKSQKESCLLSRIRSTASI